MPVSKDYWMASSLSKTAFTRPDGIGRALATKTISITSIMSSKGWYPIGTPRGTLSLNCWHWLFQKKWEPPLIRENHFVNLSVILSSTGSAALWLFRQSSILKVYHFHDPVPTFFLTAKIQQHVLLKNCILPLQCFFECSHIPLLDSYLTHISTFLYQCRFFNTFRHPHVLEPAPSAQNNKLSLFFSPFVEWLRFVAYVIVR